MVQGMMVALWIILSVAFAKGLLSYRLRSHHRFLSIALGSCLALSLFSCASDPLPNLPEERSPLAASTARTVEHAMGTMQVPLQPQRVVTIDTAALDAVLAVNLKPVGSVTREQFPAYLGEKTAGIQSVGDSNQPNLEAILALKPDLILGNKTSSQSQYKHLNRIAPTIFTERSGRDGDWKENFLLYGDALNKRSEAKQALDQYEQKVSQIKAQLPNSQQTVVSIVATNQGKVGVYSTNSFAGSILRDIGVARPEVQTKIKRHADLISREDLDSLDGDIIFLIHDPTSDSSLNRQEFINDPLWSSLKAVQGNAVFEVNSQVWAAGRNILAARQVLDDIGNALTKAGN